MKEVLTRPKMGYYMNKDVFGTRGDFITSPEISQLFGEMLAIWMISEWRKIGSPRPFQLVELGPGRGTMMADILRVFGKLGVTGDTLEVHLVEVSKSLSEIQASNLCREHGSAAESDKHPFYYRGLTDREISVFWHKSVEQLPEKFSVIVAHEFFDALPIHKFQRTSNGWREVLVDVDPQDSQKLRMVTSSIPTPASLLLIRESETRDHIEVSPSSGALMQFLAQRLEEFGGFALIADYGHSGDKGDTFRAFKKHQLHDPLCEPGTADLTADVDFSYLKKAVGDKLISFGPVTQHEFLKRLHIDVRLKKLLASSTKEQQDELLSGYKMIMDEKGMGTAFKFMCFFPSVLAEFFISHPVAGFYPET
ncbi:unnamed protein product [Nesidiocoris tenuis]|uniref:Protein arginine methyltransferase NDUFAF7 n=1 Tax=Nesidiocoris tenuis TaxID=355587 RepID=A0A6H5HUH8_9HEMI|nr:unnamed protein product [Nesidiocoris tenuis]